VLEEAIKINAGDKLILYNLSQAYYSKGELDKAIKNLEEVIYIDPSFKSAYWDLGYYYLYKGHIKGALSMWYKGIFQ
jgi:tetratricopeptide (TPR) repeat protein